jgi:hypothetical protein
MAGLQGAMHRIIDGYFLVEIDLSREGNGNATCINAGGMSSLK